MSLKWGFSTLGCPEAGLWEVLETALEFGFQAVELRFLDGDDDLNASLSRFLSVPGNARRALATGVAISCLNTSFSLSSARPADMAILRETARYADRLRAPLLRVFDGAAFGQEMTAAERAAAKANFTDWRRWRADNGIEAELALETHGATSSGEKTLALFDLLGERLPVIWDTHHSLILAGDPPERTLSLLGDSIVKVHVKDSVDAPSARHPYTYVLPGQGRMPVREILTMLERGHFAGYVVLEWEKRWHPSLPPLREAIQAMTLAAWRPGPALSS